MMTDLQVLMAARKLLMDPKRWFKGSLCHVSPETGEPCYCAIGAVGAAAGVQWDRREHVLRYDGGGTVVNYVLALPDPEVGEQWVRVSEILAHYVEDERIDSDLLYDAQEQGAGSYAEQAAPEVYVFNDQDATKYEDVMELFSRAIQDLVAKESEQEVAVS